MMSEPCAITESDPRRIARERNTLISQVLEVMAGTAQHDFISQNAMCRNPAKDQVSPEFKIFKGV